MWSFKQIISEDPSTSHNLAFGIFVKYQPQAGQCFGPCRGSKGIYDQSQSTPSAFGEDLPLCSVQAELKHQANKSLAKGIGFIQIECL